MGAAVVFLRRRALLILLCCLGLAGAAFATSVIQEPQYEAQASLLFRDPGFDQRLFGSSVFEATDPDREAATNVELVSLDRIADNTANELGRNLTGDAVRSRVSVEAAGRSDLITVTATDADPEFAARLANTFALQYIDFRRDADRAKIEEARELIEADLQRLSSAGAGGEDLKPLQEQISQLTTLEALQTGNAELVQPADPPASPSSPKTTRNTAIGGALGLIIGIGIALLLSKLDRRLRSSEDLEETFALPVLGNVPDSEVLGPGATGNGAVLSFGEAEAFRLLRTRLRYFNVDRDVRSVLVSSPSPGEGKSTIAWHLATSTAEAGVRALLIEADFHQPTVASRRGVAPLPGLAELLTHQSSLDRAIQRVPVATGQNGGRAERNLDVIVSGAAPPNPVELMESEEMARLFHELTKRYDFVVIDTPPVSVLADAIPLMKMVSGVIVVAQLGRTSRDDAARLRDQLHNLDAPMLGVIANRAAKGAGGYGYGYYGKSKEAD